MSMEQPKKPVGGSYGQFISEKRPEFMKQCEGQRASMVSKIASEEWKKLTEAEKAPYQVKFEAAKKKFDEDMAAFLAAGGEKTKGARGLRTEKRKAKEAKATKTDPNKPKRPAGGAYGCYMAKHRAEFQKECPGSITAVAKFASAKWKALPAEDKVVYEEEFKAKSEAYLQAMKSYVPPAGSSAEGEEEDTAPPSKKAKSVKAAGVNAAVAKVAKRATASKKSSASTEKKPDMEIPPDVLQKAERASMAGTLTKILDRDDIKNKGVSPKDALAALEAADGLLHKARFALLGA